VNPAQIVVVATIVAAMALGIMRALEIRNG
jgi:hypothetical protein